MSAALLPASSIVPAVEAPDGLRQAFPEQLVQSFVGEGAAQQAAIVPHATPKKKRRPASSGEAEVVAGQTPAKPMPAIKKAQGKVAAKKAQPKSKGAAAETKSAPKGAPNMASQAAPSESAKVAKGFEALFGVATAT